MLRLAPPLTVALFLGPVAAGLIGTLLPAFGYMPSIGGTQFSLAPWRELFAWPGFGTSLHLTLTIGIAATLVSFVLAAGFCALAHERARVRRLERFLAPLLATPHVAIAIGFAFLVLPSGLGIRLVTPWLTGLDRPPAIVTVRDPLGVATVAGLVLKESAFLVLMTIAASGQVAARPMLAAARALGYGPAAAWIKVVLPQIYPQIRLPLYAVLAYSLSSVEIALVLAPLNPPPLAVLATRWFSDYDLRLYFPAAAAASLQLALVLGAIACWRLAEIGVARIGRAWIARGRRRGLVEPLARAAASASLAVGATSLLSLAVMAAWSVAQAWPFPDALPRSVGLATWERVGAEALATAGTTALIAAASALLALVLVLACLEDEQQSLRGAGPGRGGGRLLHLVYVPLLVPQIAFLFGAQVALVRLNLDATLMAVIWAHLVFVLPYVFLSLADPYRALDPRYARIAAGLGATRMRIFFAVKLPLLLRPLLTALAVGFAVSVSLYLPTLFAGTGRVATLTTEAVTLSAGADRRIIGVFAFLQAVLPLAVFGAALALPAAISRNRRGLA